MPSDQPFNDHLEKIRHRIYSLIMEDARWVTIFILAPIENYLAVYHHTCFGDYADDNRVNNKQGLVEKN